MEYLDIVNKQDEVIGRAEQSEIYEKKLTHRIVHILIFNDRGEIALQLQSQNKKFCPLHWVSSAAGHVQTGETYEEAALRELEEEIGVNLPLIFLRKDLYLVSGQDNFFKFITAFKAVYNGPFEINPLEVEKVEYFSLATIKRMMERGEKIHPELKFLLTRIISK